MDEVLKLLKAVTGDRRYEEILYDGGQTRREVRSMCDVATRLEERGVARGMKEGIAKGMEKGLVKGAFKKAVDVYKNCISRGMSREDALAISELREEDIKGIAESGK